MNDDTNKIDLERTEALWNALGDRLEAFITVWEQCPQSPPDVNEYLLSESPVARRISLVELIKVDMEYRWQAGDRRTVEQYAASFPDLDAGEGVSHDLIYEEFHIRRRAGQEVDHDEFLSRFPQHESALRRLLMLEPGEKSGVSLGKPNLALTVGDSIDDFDIFATLGEGAFASVYLARQRGLQRMVALKISADQGREPQTLAQMDHPNIVRVFDQRQASDHNVRLLYMQYVPGCTLRDVIQHCRLQHPPRAAHIVEAINEGLDRLGEERSVAPGLRRLGELSFEEAVVDLALQVAAALEYAHDQQVLHRDLKPANILLSREGTIKLVDFNISYCSKLDGASAAANFGGSLAYMSPEQLEAMNPAHAREADSLGPASDLFSFGVVFWELLAGKRPFEDRLVDQGALTLTELTSCRRRGIDLDALQQLRAESSTGLPNVIARCLEADPETRVGSAAEIHRQLRLCLHKDVRRLIEHGSSRAGSPIVGALVLVLALVLPNAVAGIFNYYYNERQIIQALSDSATPFYFVQLAINSVAFPLGALLGCWLAWPLVSAAAGRDNSPETLIRARRRGLRLGHLYAVISIIEWLIAGIAYPIALYASGVRLSPNDSLHFFGSLTVCGLIAMSYPFFLTGYLVVHWYYPALLGRSALPLETAGQGRELDVLHRSTWIYLALAALVPMLGTILLQGINQTPNRLAVLSLCGFGLLGFAVVVWAARRMQRAIGWFQRYLDEPNA